MSCLRIFLSELHSLEWVGILLARIAVGLLFFLSGRGKLFVPERRDQMRQTLIEGHVPFPDFNAIFVSNLGVCLRIIARHRSADAACVRDARMRYDRGDCGVRDSKG
jgi:hypothetical protein